MNENSLIFRQRLRETSMELKELQSKLRAAYVNKELCAQKAEREAARIEAKVLIKYIFMLSVLIFSGYNIYIMYIREIISL